MTKQENLSKMQKSIQMDITLKLTETTDNFIFEQILPFCESVLKKTLSKEELKRILIRGSEPTWNDVHDESDYPDWSGTFLCIDVAGDKRVCDFDIKTDAWTYEEDGCKYYIDIQSWMRIPEHKEG